MGEWGWVFVGYSLPSEDVAVRTLLVRARLSARPQPEIRIVSKGEEARARYQVLFGEEGPGHFCPDGLEVALDVPDLLAMT